MQNKTLNNLGLLLVRLLAGGMMLTHGIPKIGRLLGEGPVKFANPFGIGPEVSLIMAIFSEVVCSILIMVGFKTRIATIPLMITMLVAAFYAHWNDPFGKKELPLLYFAVFLGILIAGAGKFSLDSAKKP
ncbi:DoxX family protein [Algoriphagus sp. AK58]|uniref:DoxX family protein n=1 Tax=Algoriphagus sp. AK58 TaxID=1406877 RepID=UPI00164FE30A|nr:DoxX family protein [Algoriphagus sp. AK58]MBC6368173.1 DoxX family protein [Algoriphagus sp. AK58]